VQIQHTGTEQKPILACSGSKSILRKLFINNALPTEPSNYRLDLAGNVQKSRPIYKEPVILPFTDREN